MLILLKFLKIYVSVDRSLLVGIYVGIRNVFPLEKILFGVKFKQELRKA